MHNHALKPALQAFFLDSGFARYSIPVLLSPRHSNVLTDGCVAVCPLGRERSAHYGTNAILSPFMEIFISMASFI